MTMQIAMSRSREYALLTADSSLYLRPPGLTREDHEVGGLAVSELYEVDRKAVVIGRSTLVGIGGCIALGADFRKLLSALTTTDDDIDQVYAKAREVIAFLRAHDAPGEIYDVADVIGLSDEARAAAERDPSLSLAGATGVRGSVDHDLTVIMTGFRHDGTSVLIQYGDTGEGAADFEDYDGDESPSDKFTMGVPMGVPMEEVLEFFVILESLGASRAFAHAFIAHATVHAKYPDRVTPDVSFWLMEWFAEDAAPAVVGFSIDVRDHDSCVEIFSALASVEATRQAAA